MNNPFDSDYSESTKHEHGRGGVAFDLDAIAASRRAMISGKAPSGRKPTSHSNGASRPGHRSHTTATTTTTTRKPSSAPRRRDVEAGDGRAIREKVRTKRTASESMDESSQGFDSDHPIPADKRYEDEAGDSDGSSSSNDSDSDDSSYDSIDEQKKRRKPYVYAVMALVSIVLLVGIITLSVVVFGGKKGTQYSTPILTARQEALHNIIKAVVDSNLLTDPESPQYRAHQWLLYEDSLGLAPASGASRERVLQRYALAAFYFATGGPQSWKGNTWMEGDECEEDWDGVGCTDDGIIHVLSMSKLQNPLLWPKLLYTVDASHSFLADLRSIGNFGLSGSIPDEVAHLSLLEHLILKNNAELVGTIPIRLGQLQGLRQLGVYNNNIEGTIPSQLFQATNLKFINLQNNDLSGSLPNSIESLDRLETLVLMNNKLTGEVPFGGLSSTKVKFLGLSHNEFSGTISPMLGVLDHLEFLYLDGNSFGGNLPETISQLTSLSE